MPISISELLKAFLQVPELSTLGSAEERAAFIAIRLDGRTVRDTGQAVGISKSNVKSLADLFQSKLNKKIKDMGKRSPTMWSAEYLRL
jgi:DNA-directed RNA polymerase specialized sigma24 family protein